MKLSEFIHGLNGLIEQNPNLLEANVVTSIDDEGNGFNEIYYKPTIGKMIDGEFSTEEVNGVITVCVN